MIIWCDLETTGLDERTESILEAAFVVTDDDLNELGAMDVVVKPVGGLDTSKMHPVVLDMHTKNNLINDVEERGFRRYEAEQMILDFLQPYFSESALRKREVDSLPLSGSTVHFDRAFLKIHMPKLEAKFHYRNIDVSTFTETVSRWRPEIYKERPSIGGTAHRALADIRHSINQLRYYREKLGI